MNTKIIILCSLFGLFISTPMQGDEIRTKSWFGRTVIEKSHVSRFTGQTTYEYKIDDCTQKIEKIKKEKKAFGDYNGYPQWNLNTKEKFKEFDEYIKNSFTSNLLTGKTAKEYLKSCDYLINDNGEVICYSIRTSKSLFEIYFTYEILNIFDKINTFKFQTPIVRVPKDGIGYEIVSTWLISSNND